MQHVGRSGRHTFSRGLLAPAVCLALGPGLVAAPVQGVEPAEPSPTGVSAGASKSDLRSDYEEYRGWIAYRTPEPTSTGNDAAVTTWIADTDRTAAGGIYAGGGHVFSSYVDCGVPGGLEYAGLGHGTFPLYGVTWDEPPSDQQGHDQTTGAGPWLSFYLVDAHPRTYPVQGSRERGGCHPPRDDHITGDVGEALPPYWLKVPSPAPAGTWPAKLSGTGFHRLYDFVTTYVACLSRSTIDTDGDGFPDDVDLVPGRPGLGTKLGDPAGPNVTMAVPKLGGSTPSTPDGLPACPASRAQDSDQDGIADSDELADETDPFDVDTDGDGAWDGSEAYAATSPLDWDSDDGSVNDGRELTYATNPLSALDDVPLPFEIMWRQLVDKSAKDFKAAEKFGGATASYYHQVLNLVCSAAGVSSTRPGGAATMAACPKMRKQVLKMHRQYGDWAGDFVYDVFQSFLPTVNSGEIRATGKKARRLVYALCAFAAVERGPITGANCLRHKNDIGFSFAGAVHAAHHLYPNFVKVSKEIALSANGGTRLQETILADNLSSERRQHKALFRNAVVPGFKAVGEISGPFKWLATEVVPFAATCEREHAIKDALVDAFGDAGVAIYGRTDSNQEGKIIRTKRCKLWMQVAKRF